MNERGITSPANNLTKNTECGSSSKLPCVVDKRLKDLKESRGFTSFNSDTSAQTSGSTCSATSLDALLEGRQVNPVQVLMNLGFGYSADTCNNMMRVPERFLMQQSHATGIDLNEILVDYPELHRLVMKRTSTRAGQCLRSHNPQHLQLDDALRLSCVIESKVPSYFPRRQLSAISDGPTLVGSLDVSEIEADAQLCNVDDEKPCSIVGKDKWMSAKDSSGLEQQTKVDECCSPLQQTSSVCSVGGKVCSQEEGALLHDGTSVQKGVKLQQSAEVGSEKSDVPGLQEEGLYISSADVKFVLPKDGRMLHPLRFDLCKSECDTVSMSSGSTVSLEMIDVYHKVSLSPNESLV